MARSDDEDNEAGRLGVIVWWIAKIVFVLWIIAALTGVVLALI